MRFLNPSSGGGSTGGSLPPSVMFTFVPHGTAGALLAWQGLDGAGYQAYASSGDWSNVVPLGGTTASISGQSRQIVAMALPAEWQEGGETYSSSALPPAEVPYFNAFVASRASLSPGGSTQSGQAVQAGPARFYRVQQWTTDSDGDGVFDSEEIENGQNPYDSDTDGDGIPDGADKNATLYEAPVITLEESSISVNSVLYDKPSPPDQGSRTAIGATTVTQSSSDAAMFNVSWTQGALGLVSGTEWASVTPFTTSSSRSEYKGDLGSSSPPIVEYQRQIVQRQFRLKASRAGKRDETRTFLLVERFRQNTPASILEATPWTYGTPVSVPLTITAGQTTSSVYNVSGVVPNWDPAPAYPAQGDAKAIREWVMLAPEFLNAYQIPADSLKVAKLPIGTALNGIPVAGELDAEVLDPEQDPDRFYIRLRGLAGFAAAGACTVHIGTARNRDSAYNDNPTEIELKVAGDDLISSAQILVSDNVDDMHSSFKNYSGSGPDPIDIPDDTLNDPTHKVALGGRVLISKVRLGGAVYVVNASVPVPVRKNLKIERLLLKPSLGVNPYMTAAQSKADVNVIGERFAQVGIYVDMRTREIIVKPGDGYNTDISTGGLLIKEAGGYSEVGAFLTEHATPSKDDLQVFYVHRLPQPHPEPPLKGVMMGFFYLSYGYNAFIGMDDRTVFTSAHEIGHALGLSGIHPDQYAPGSTPTNLMRTTTSSDADSIGRSKRLTQNQENTIYSSGLLKSSN